MKIFKIVKRVKSLKEIRLVTSAATLMIGISLFTSAAKAQTNAAPPIPALPPMASPAQQAAAQAAGQQIMDTVPGFSILTNLPSAPFDQAKLEVYAGLENSGAALQSVIGADYNFHTNFFARGQMGLGATPSVINSVGLGGGIRLARPTWEIYGGILGQRNWLPGLDTWQGEVFAGTAYKPSSGFAIFCQVGTLASKSTKSPSLDLLTGITLPLPGF